MWVGNEEGELGLVGIGPSQVERSSRIISKTTCHNLHGLLILWRYAQGSQLAMHVIFFAVLCRIFNRIDAIE